MASELTKVWDEGEIVEIFPYGTNGEQEALVTYGNKLYHIHLSGAGHPLAVLGVQDDNDYDDYDVTEGSEQEEHDVGLSSFLLNWVDEEDEIDPSMLSNIDEEE